MKNYYTKIIDTRLNDKYSFSTVSRELGIGRNKILKILRMIKALDNNNSVNPGFKQWIVEDKGSWNGHIFTIPRLTPYGYEKLIEIVLKVGILDLSSISLKDSKNSPALVKMVKGAHRTI